jgi:hypothetical protein
MSAALAAARKRRAGIDTPSPAQSPIGKQQPMPQNGLTLPQVISLVDSRLITLEKFMKETKEASIQQPVQQQNESVSSSDDLDELAEEMNNRFAMLATEIADLKDVVLKLQSFTMEVNKTMYESINMNMNIGQSFDEEMTTMEISELQ